MMNDIRDLADSIARSFHPEQIILFGSYAQQTFGSDSDVDLLVIMPYGGKSWRTSAEIRNRVRPHFPVDLMVRSPEQIRKRLAMGDMFVRDILANGEVLYKSDNC